MKRSPLLSKIAGTRGVPRCCRGAWIAVACAVTFSLLLAAGCVSQPRGVPTTVATEQDDVPYPDRFTFDATRSYSLAPRTAAPQGRYRSWRGFYKGESEQGVVLSFYIKQMPEHGWKLEKVDSLAKKLYFEKSNEYAEIEIAREIDQEAGKYLTVVKATIRPLGPENFSVEENIHRLRNDSGPQPASGPAGEATGGGKGSAAPSEEAQPGESKSGAHSVTPAVTPGREPSNGSDAKVLKEIDQVDKGYE